MHQIAVACYVQQIPCCPPTPVQPPVCCLSIAAYRHVQHGTHAEVIACALTPAHDLLADSDPCLTAPLQEVCSDAYKAQEYLYHMAAQWDMEATIAAFQDKIFTMGMPNARLASNMALYAAATSVVASVWPWMDINKYLRTDLVPYAARNQLAASNPLAGILGLVEVMIDEGLADMTFMRLTNKSSLHPNSYERLAMAGALHSRGAAHAWCSAHPA